MISQATILEWQNIAPWQVDEQIEQDLIISRILTEIYQSDLLRDRLLFRGGTALHKLYFPEPLRYSEDLDFVQIKSEPADPIADEIRKIVEPWLGKAQTDARRDSFIIFQERLSGAEHARKAHRYPISKVVGRSYLMHQ